MSSNINYLKKRRSKSKHFLKYERGLGWNLERVQPREFRSGILEKPGRHIYR